MDKISSILPATPRVTSVDLRESSPVRAGTVGFGQAEASSASRRAGHAVRGASLADEAGMNAVTGRPMSKDEQQAELVRKMNANFFNTNRSETFAPSAAGPQSPGTPTAANGGPSQISAGTQVSTSAAQEQAKMESLPEKPEEELSGGPSGFFKDAPRVDELYPKGSFLNTVA